MLQPLNQLCALLLRVGNGSTAGGLVDLEIMKRMTADDIGNAPSKMIAALRYGATVQQYLAFFVHFLQRLYAQPCESWEKLHGGNNSLGAFYGTAAACMVPVGCRIVCSGPVLCTWPIFPVYISCPMPLL